MENKRDRFIDIKKLQTLYMQKEKIETLITSFPVMHCKMCGDTNPKHGFYPILSGTFIVGKPETSGLTCNRCALTDEEYLNRFGEKKEEFKTSS